MTSHRLTRRHFLRSSTAASAGILVAAFGAGVLRMLWSNEQSSPDPVVTVAREDFPDVNGTPYLSEAGHFYLTRTDDGLLALFWLCTRLHHCTVVWAEHEHGGQFRCPCCGTAWDRHGVWQSGPGPRPLDLMRLSLDDDGNARVNTRVIMQREKYRPEQAVRV
jgi:cytochrome b6-f complex iron-sulfur subunit